MVIRNIESFYKIFKSRLSTIRVVDLSARVHVGNCNSQKICINCGGIDRPITVTVLLANDPLFDKKAHFRFATTMFEMRLEWQMERWFPAEHERESRKKFINL